MRQISSKTLYDSDFALWVEDTVKKLKAKNTQDLDWENLIEQDLDILLTKKLWK